jgi:thymidylate synthase (FAD)
VRRQQAGGLSEGTTVVDLTPDQLSELEAHRAQRHETGRATVPALEELLYLPIQILDHGFVRVVDYMGDDSSIVQAARVSYGRGTRRTSEDRGLIRYLMRHRHTTPFEMCELKLHVKLPIFVARQWIRHRTASVNEYSARYSILDREFYVPSPDAIAGQSQHNRQGRGAPLSADDATRVQALLRDDAERAYEHYEELLNEGPQARPLDPDRPGLARELARMNLSLNYYTQWYWKIDLHNLLHFLTLRADQHAQHEIRLYAEAILEQVVRRWVPLTYQAFRDYRLESQVLSAKSLAVVRSLVSGRRSEAEALRKENGIAPREWRELMDALEL